MPGQRLPKKVLFSMPDSERRKPKGGRGPTWQKGMKSVTRAWDQWVRAGFLDGVDVTILMPGSKLCKIWLLIGVSGACAVSLYLDRLIECLEV